MFRFIPWTSALFFLWAVACSGAVSIHHPADAGPVDADASDGEQRGPDVMEIPCVDEDFCWVLDGETGPCEEVVCAQDKGVCVLSAIEEGAPCDDGDACTVGEQCFQGVCTGGSDRDCSDDNPCTDDLCDTQGETCQHIPNSALCDDGDVCTEADGCSEGLCVGVQIDCDDDNPCTDEQCDSDGQGCVYSDAVGDCDDSNPCTEADHCDAGACVGTSSDCDDDNPCTMDTCTPLAGCLNEPQQSPCDDGNACTAEDVCQAGVCLGTPTICVDGDQCTFDDCAPSIGCVYEDTSALCDDGNGCTDDSCDPISGCNNVFNQLPCDDLDVCTDNDGCLEGGCVGIPMDGPCVVPCGDGLCTNEETCESCATDCGDCQLKGSCCEAKTTPGCDEEDVEACVCEIDDFCCEFFWDAFCIPNAMVCGMECTTCGDGVCLGDEDCVACPMDCGECDPAGDCCAANDTPGCDDVVVTACACIVEPACCDTPWSSVCASIATEHCASGCPATTCGDGYCNQDEHCIACAEDCGDCVAEGSCCEALDHAGCEDPLALDCVCALDPYCCLDAWDAICAEEAMECGQCPGCGDGLCAPDESCSICPGDCGVCPLCGDGLCDLSEDCMACPADCGACFEGQCCEGNPTPGCDDLSVTLCVCMLDSFCCHHYWDESCVGTATVACALSCPAAVCADAVGDCLEKHTSPGCGDPGCCEAVCLEQPACCDTLWGDACVETASLLCAGP